MIFLLLSVLLPTAWSQQETPEELRLRMEYSRRAREAQLLETAREANRVLDNLDPASPRCASEDPSAVMTPELPERFIVVGVSGYGTGEDGEGEPSGAHDNLPMSADIAGTYRLTHGAKNSQLDEVLANFNCSNGAQGTERLGLIIMANSWGAGKGNKLAKRYKEKCGREVELFVMVDGIAKPIPTAYGKRPPSRRCVNYYQTRSTLRGKSIEGCENHDLEDRCTSGGLANCHIETEWIGTAMGAELIRDLITN